MEPNLTVHDMKHGEPFHADALYIHDSGCVYCGAHVGTEATYQAQAWSCIGRGPLSIIEGVSYRCEIPHRN